MSLTAAAAAILAGSPEELARALARADVGAPPPQRPTHPLWAWVERFQSAPPDYPWDAMVATWVAHGGAVNPFLEATAVAWKKANGNERARYAAGRLLHGGRRDAPLASLLRRAVALDATAAVRAWLKAGASPWEGIPERWPGEHPADNGAAWYALRSSQKETAELLLAATQGPLPPSRRLADWLIHANPTWPSSHPLWARLPSPQNPAWQAAIRAEWGRLATPCVGTWWRVRPDHRRTMAHALASAGENPWPGILPSLDAGVPEELKNLPAPMRIEFPLGPGPARTEKVALPALQWARHAPSLGNHTVEDVDPTLRARSLAALEACQPDWTAAGEGAWTEGELAQLLSSSCEESPQMADDAVWQDHPEWMAPHAQTGRTPLWHATDADSAARWWARGCALDAIDAEGNQVFTVLVARSMLAGRTGSELGSWALERLRAGDAPAQGMAWGRPLSEWVQGRADLAAALARRTGNPPEKEPLDALFVRAARLDKDEVRRLLREGANPCRADATGQTPLLAALRAGIDGPTWHRHKRDIVRALFQAGAPYLQPGGVLPLQVLMERPLRKKEKEHQDLLRELLARHAQAAAPWTPQLSCQALERVQDNDIWAELPLSTRQAWRAALLDPHWEGSLGAGKDVALRARLLLRHAFSDLNTDGALDSAEPWRAWSQWLKAGAPASVQEEWHEWLSRGGAGVKARWAAIELDLEMTPPSPVPTVGARTRRARL